MNLAFLEIILDIYFWVMLAGIIGAYISLRFANHYRDQASQTDLSENSGRFVFRSRILFNLFIVFLVAMFGGMSIFAYQVLQLYRPALLQVARIPTNETPDPTAAPQITPTPTIQVRTATPAPTSTPRPTETATQAISHLARVGNTNYQGVNVRAGPGLDKMIVAKLSPGVMVEIFNRPTEESDGYSWQYVRLDVTMEGWIADEFLIPVQSTTVP